MVATVGKLTSSAQAGSYYEADDYYLSGEESPSAWMGHGAKELGLEGSVDRQVFQQLLEGKVAGVELGTTRDGKLIHAAGWDITLSAPKGLSILALLSGDKRLVEAHRSAAQTAISHLEKHLTLTRIRNDSGIQREATGKLVIASFLHSLSRSEQAQLHSHHVILNMTKSADGQWRSLDPRTIYQFQKDIGALYRQELAHRAEALGYEIERGKDSLFDIRGVPQSVIEAFSTRTAEIDAWLADRGTSRAEASPEQRQLATLDTRQPKREVSREALLSAWQAEAASLGFDRAAQEQLVEAAKAKSASKEINKTMLADKAISHAAESLGEREAVFSTTALHRVAGDYALGKLGYKDVGAALERSTSKGDLVPREFVDRRGVSFPGFTTRENIQHEATLLRIEIQGRGKAQPILDRMEAAKTTIRAERQSERAGHSWTEGQKSATIDMLSSRDRISAIQGLAGTAKTTTVVATIAKAAKARGIAVMALAPTASAASVLGEALEQRSDTLARHLISPERSSSGGKSLWLVDEASLISARDMARLFEAATKADARLILIGDAAQLGSVGAGRAFAQLQEMGMRTAILEEIVRQTNSKTKEAVEASIAGDAKRALGALDSGGGKIIAQPDIGERLKEMAKDYAQLPERDRKQTLVIEPSRAGRDMLNSEIRSRLKVLGILSGDEAKSRALEAKGLTKAEAREARHYEQGDVIRFAKAYPDKNVSRGEALSVARVDIAKNAVTLEKADGGLVDWRPRQWGATKSEAFTSREIGLMKGDRIAFTRNDRSLHRINGGRAEVLGIDAVSQTARIRMDNGRTQELGLERASDQHIRHAYAQTTYAAQGQTAERVIVHADSRSTNLVDQKMIYVAISRAKEHATVYTDDRSRLMTALVERSGEKQAAIAPAESMKKSAQFGLG